MARTWGGQRRLSKLLYGGEVALLCKVAQTPTTVAFLTVIRREKGH